MISADLGITGSFWMCYYSYSSFVLTCVCVCVSGCLPFPLPDRDEHVQGCVLLHALCPGCIWLAHVPNEEACLWAVPPRQLLPVSTQKHTRTVLIYLASVSLEPLQCRSNFTCVQTCQVVIHWDNTTLVRLTDWHKQCRINHLLLSTSPARGH